MITPEMLSMDTAYAFDNIGEIESPIHVGIVNLTIREDATIDEIMERLELDSYQMEVELKGLRSVIHSIKIKNLLLH